MSVYFLDGSAIAKRYVMETGSIWITGLVKQSVPSRVHVARICGVEVLAAITRRVRSGNLTQQAGRIAAIQFRADFHKMQGIIEVSPALISRAIDLTEEHGLRGYDAVQLLRMPGEELLPLISSWARLLVCRQFAGGRN